MKNQPTLSKRDSFIDDMAYDSSFYLLFDDLPGISFFAKNDRFEIVCANKGFYERLGYRKELDVVGKSDFELFPKSLAEHFRENDLSVLKSGEPKLNIVELFINRDGLPDWYLTNKIPVFGKSGKVIGVMGTSQSYHHGKRFIQPYLQIENAIRFIQDNFRSKISAEEIAKKAHLSTRQLNRRFQETLKMSPQEFIMRLRIKTACDDLSESSNSILDIALSLGFYDQSTFTLQFRKHMGITPLQYRKQHRSSMQESEGENR